MDKIISAIFLGIINGYILENGHTEVAIGIITTIIFLIYFENKEKKIEKFEKFEKFENEMNKIKLERRRRK